MNNFQGQGTVGTDKNIKVFKTATQVSIMDVMPSLDYYREKQNEYTYRGNMAFLINEYGRSKDVLTAFLPKATCKTVFRSIIDGSFMNLFPRGYEKYGGSPKTKRARTFRISFELNHNDFTKSRYVFQIDEGVGVIGNNGQITMQKREKSVRTYVNIHLALDMAHEIIDYINHEELIGLMNNKPLYTWSTYSNNQQQNQQYNNQAPAPFPSQPPVQQHTQSFHTEQQMPMNEPYQNQQQLQANNYYPYNNQQVQRLG